MRVLMIAPPGAGKGTQGALIAAHFNVPHIATGDLLRDHVAQQTQLGQAVKQYLERGELVPDEIVLDMVRQAFIAAKAAGGGYLLDGIPRNMAQARATYQIARELGMTADVGDAAFGRRRPGAGNGPREPRRRVRSGDLNGEAHWSILDRADAALSALRLLAGRSTQLSALAVVLDEQKPDEWCWLPHRSMDIT